MTMKTAVVFYSHSGNTDFFARRIAEALGAELFSLEPSNPLKGSGLFSMIKGGGQALSGKTPALKELPDVSSFDRVVFGTPVWAGKCAAPAWTFVASGALRGKEISAFTLSAGGEGDKALRQIASGTKKILASVSLWDRRTKNAGANDELLSAFLEKLKA